MRNQPVGKLMANSTMLVTAIAMSLLPIGQFANADINSEMQSLYSGSGTLGNYTAPGAFKSQTMNVYSGGSLQVRTPVRTYSLMSMKMPSLKAGCGGIDFDLGSFSHINKAQFKALLQAIGNNTVGLLFQSALASITPLIASKLEWLEDVQRFVNLNNIDSCKAAEGLVMGMSGATGLNAQSACKGIARTLFGEDEKEATGSCATGADTINAQGEASGNPALAGKPPRDVNVIWEAMSQSSLSKDEKEIVMNMVGTVLIYASSDTGPKSIDPSIPDIKTLIGGNSAGSNGDVVIDKWQECQDPKCMNIKSVSKTITPFPKLVSATLNGLVNKIATRTTPTTAEIGFVNATTLPVYKMLAVSTRATGSGLAETLIEKYKTVIAYDYAYAFMKRSFSDSQTLLRGFVTRNQTEVLLKKDLEDTIRQQQDVIRHELAAAYQTAAAMNTVVDDIQKVERQVNMAMPSHLMASVNFSAALGRNSR